jgi:hypothetical protein
MLPIMNPDAAEIDIGAEEIFVAVPPDRDIDSVRRFGTFTRDLIALADWLRQCNIRSVAMESTGVYWIPLYQILETHGLEVFLVNAHHVKNVPGRKSDVSDCQWIQLSAFGGIAEGQLPAAGQDMRDSVVMEASGKPRPNGGRAHTAHAKGTKSDESATAPCTERHHRGQRDGNSGCHPGWGKESNQARRVV